MIVIMMNKKVIMMKNVKFKKKNSKILNSIKIAFAALSLLLIYPVLASAASENLVANPGFENGTTQPLNWSMVTVGGNIPTWDSVSHTGARSIEISISGTKNSLSGYPQSDLIAAVPLQSYILSVWVKASGSGGSNSPAVRVVELDGNKASIRQTSIYFNQGTYDWTQKQITFQASVNTKYLYIYANIWRGYGTFWVDDLILTGPSTPTPIPTPIPTSTPTPTPTPISTTPIPTPTPTPNSDLVAYWKFDENTGTTAYDSSGNGNTGTINGATWTAGTNGSALQFNGINDYVNVPDSSSLDATTLTFMAWIKNSEPDSQITADRVVSKKVNWNDANGWSIEINGINGGGAGDVTVLGSGSTFTHANVLPSWDNAWHHLAVVMSGSSAIIYLDGSLKGTYAINSLVTNNVPLAIGRLQAGTNYFNGTIDGVKIYNRALNSSEIAADYLAGTTYTPAPITPTPTPTPAPITPTPTPTPAPITGNIYYVAKNGNNNNPGTQTQPWLTIQKAANTMVAGDTVYVRAGTYNEQVTPKNSGSVGKPITYSAYPGETVYIDGTGLSIGVYDGLFEISSKDYITVKNFIFSNSPGRGVFMVGNYLTVSNNTFSGTFGASPISTNWVTTPLQNLTIENNDINPSPTAGIYSEVISTRATNNMIIRGNHIHRNLLGGGEGIVIGWDTTNGQIYSNIVEGTKIGLHVAAYNSITNWKIYNNIFRNNDEVGMDVTIENGGNGGAIIDGIDIFNNLIYNNPDGIRVDGYHVSGSAGTIRNINFVNNVFFSNAYNDVGSSIDNVYNVLFRNNIFSGSGLTVYSKSTVTNISLDHNIFYNSGGCQGTSCSTADPKFVNPTGGDFHLQTGSLAIDTGTSLGAPSFDFDGNSRPHGAGYDIGAYEYIG